MWQIYGGASVTIAAASSVDSTVGCLYTRKDVHQFPIRAASSLGTEMFIRFPRNDNFYNDLSSAKFGAYPSSDNLPLVLRKWTYQERMMSRRILYYTEVEIIWECRKEVFCECDAHIHGAKEPLSSALKAFWQNIAGNITPSLRLHQYLDAIEKYSVRSLTFPRDVLPAFSAVARAFNNTRTNKYCAGLWTEGLPAQLCWTISKYANEEHPSIFPTYASVRNLGVKQFNSQNSSF